MKRPRVLICAPRMPEYDRERGSQRILELIEFMRDAGWAVTFVPQNPAGRRYARMLRQHGVATYEGFNDEFSLLVASSQFDLAILVFWYIAETCIPIIRANSPETRILVDSIDLQFVRNARRLCRSSERDECPGMLDAAYATEIVREVNAYVAADGVLAVSEKEAQITNDMTGQPDLAHCLPLSERPIPLVDIRNRNGVLFVGNFRHPPNVEAVEYLLTAVLPKLGRRISVEHPIHIVGNDLPDHLRRLAEGREHIRMVGWVPSVVPYVQRARVAVVPLLHGAGVKGKVIQALMAGTPTVSTTIGAEGLNLRHREHLLIADEPDDFANAIAQLIKDDRLATCLAHRGRRAMAARHGPRAIRDRLMGIIASVLSRDPKPARFAEAAPVHPWRAERLRYQRLVERIRTIVGESVPRNSTLVVVGKGDEALVRFEGCDAWHFPQDSSGRYAGHYPADSAAAIDHLESLRLRGAQFLLIPQTALWWLDYYQQFREHLEQRYRVVVREDDACIVFGLQEISHTVSNTDVLMSASSTAV